MRKIGLKFIGLLFIILLVSCGTKDASEDDSQHLGDISFERIAFENTPDDIKTAIQYKLHEEATFTLPKDDEIYVVITRGEQPTGGYTVEITNVENRGDFVAVLYLYKDPADDEVVTQAITYPLDIVKIKRVNKPIKFKRTEHVNEKDKGIDINL